MLQLIDLRTTASDERSWIPTFDWTVEYEHPRWWNRQLGDDPWLVHVLEDGEEVARVDFDDPGCINHYYGGVPELEDERLEIQYIEVATAARGRGIGGQVVRRLADRHPDRRLFAYSVDADWFWERLGWKPFYDSRYGSAGSPLFIQPEVSSNSTRGAL
ncbi:N-acetyltransferase [Mycolicibacterium neoaurum]|uniref:N-acetyltransferase n=1 Tax=Mycolicibacterium neoaurum TaxID=1795 RepID=UPI001F4CC6D4|nr:N-acetyltransferase [Mycolicibacterium neoaurum]